MQTIAPNSFGFLLSFLHVFLKVSSFFSSGLKHHALGLWLAICLSFCSLNLFLISATLSVCLRLSAASCLCPTVSSIYWAIVSYMPWFSFVLSIMLRVCVLPHLLCTCCSTIYYLLRVSSMPHAVSQLLQALCNPHLNQKPARTSPVHSEPKNCSTSPVHSEPNLLAHLSHYEIENLLAHLQSTLNQNLLAHLQSTLNQNLLAHLQSTRTGNLIAHPQSTLNQNLLAHLQVHSEPGARAGSPARSARLCFNKLERQELLR
ncbi:hypothetical protein HNY73_015238 [Argiope bruennichi]|uniref:Uncharacterized protein n=1 Tax=Argiope bruennichi TaxID=94029 RepID=A0A8T0ETD9_ARGBR|nr:hypothetical protein HNY73_015238 [Argiope bruennichi]